MPWCTLNAINGMEGSHYDLDFLLGNLLSSKVRISHFHIFSFESLQMLLCISLQWKVVSRRKLMIQKSRKSRKSRKSSSCEWVKRWESMSSPPVGDCFRLLLRRFFIFPLFFKDFPGKENRKCASVTQWSRWHWKRLNFTLHLSRAVPFQTDGHQRPLISASKWNTLLLSWFKAKSWKNCSKCPSNKWTEKIISSR